MFGLGRLGKLGSVGRALAAWTPAQLWPLGASSPGMWIDPPYTASLFSTSTGTTAISAIGTVLDTSNPVGLVLDRKGGATALADPGIHLLQATATSRPVASARVNLLTYTEDFSNAAWVNQNCGLSAAPDPLGGATATTITALATNAQIYQNLSSVTAIRVASGWIRRRTGTGAIWMFADSGVGGENITGEVTSEWTQFDVSATASTGSWYLLLGTSGDAVDVWHPQCNFGPTALPYQQVNSASDYDTSAGPTYLKFDGVDDSLASATFAAGTLTSSMDCLIAVRRDSTADVIAGIYKTTNDTLYSGFAQSGAGGAANSNCGTPTTLVDGTQLTGGTAVTRGTLHTALTAGAWHILEFRGLDLSAWTAHGWGNAFSGYTVNGALGGIQLFASGQDANRDLARAQMAAYFGVTLP